MFRPPFHAVHVFQAKVSVAGARGEASVVVAGGALGAMYLDRPPPQFIRESVEPCVLGIEASMAAAAARQRWRPLVVATTAAGIAASVAAAMADSMVAPSLAAAGPASMSGVPLVPANDSAPHLAVGDLAGQDDVGGAASRFKAVNSAGAAAGGHVDSMRRLGFAVVAGTVVPSPLPPVVPRLGGGSLDRYLATHRPPLSRATPCAREAGVTTPHLTDRRSVSDNGGGVGNESGVRDGGGSNSPTQEASSVPVTGDGHDPSGDQILLSRGNNQVRTEAKGSSAAANGSAVVLVASPSLDESFPPKAEEKGRGEVAASKVSAGKASSSAAEVHLNMGSRKEGGGGIGGARAGENLSHLGVDVAKGSLVPALFRPAGREADVLCMWTLDLVRPDNGVGTLGAGSFGESTTRLPRHVLLSGLCAVAIVVW